MFVPPRRALLILALALLAGCGTLTATAEKGPSIYGGVRRAFHDCLWAHDPAEGRFWLGDIPLSAVADTAMLPVTIPIAAASRDDAATSPHATSGNDPCVRAIRSSTTNEAPSGRQDARRRQLRWFELTEVRLAMTERRPARTALRPRRAGRTR
jgi:uncharacterized protein YceK